MSPAARKFVLHWGEMGTRWGINRSVAQIHALLYISPKPIPAEEIAATLQIARSNVSNSLRELLSWRIVRVVHEVGDRRDFYESLGDVWEMFRIILEERKQREVDPTLRILRECVEAAETDRQADAHLKKRLGGLLEFFETADRWYGQMSGLPLAAAKRFLKLGAGIRKLVMSGRKKSS